MRTLVWRRLDEPGMEVAHIDSFSRAEGTQIGRGYEARWRLDGKLLQVDVVGRDRVTAELGDADFFDLFASPFFNSLPVMRDGLLQAGPAHDYLMRFVTLPEMDVLRSEQRYDPRGDRTVAFSSGTFAADIEFDAEGFVTVYRGFLERIA